ncbi:MAG: LysM peptidoglycan-binding domain-containing protein [Treponema sp.]|nr:LysM peptidoglycan-binding domain-containing protein [Treponema sp.]
MMKYLTKKSLTFISIFLFLSFCIFADTSYKVNKGDTLYSISRKYQITVAELRAANNLSENDVLKAGQKLIIPEADISTAVALSGNNNNKSDSPVNTSNTTEIEVKKGDTLYSLSKKYGLTVADLLAINNLDSSSVIKVGQKLKVRTTSLSNASQNKSKAVNVNNDIKVVEKAPDTRTYGVTVTADTNTKWPVSNPKITQVKGKISGVQLSAKENEKVLCIHEGTVMYVGTYRGFGQVVFVQSKTGLIYAYTGLGSVKVKKGEYVVAAAELGSAGIDPISGKSQITFMVFQNGQPIDPGKAPRS